jgi:hypothetical protein
MNLDEIVGKVIKRRRCFVVPQFPAESIRQASVPPHFDSDGPILALDVAGRNMGRVRITGNRFNLDADALGGRVAGRDRIPAGRR